MNVHHALFAFFWISTENKILQGQSMLRIYVCIGIFENIYLHVYVHIYIHLQMRTHFKHCHLL